MLLQVGSTSPMECAFDQIAASVAPPNPSTAARGKSARTESGNVTGIQSPLSNTARRCARASAGCDAADSAGTMRSRVAGVEFQIVMRFFTTSWASVSGSANTAELGTTRMAPAPSTPNTSYTDRSNEGEFTNSARSPGPTWQVRDTQSRVFTTARWLITTPFGSPVLPDVLLSLFALVVW